MLQVYLPTPCQLIVKRARAPVRDGRYCIGRAGAQNLVSIDPRVNILCTKLIRKRYLKYLVRECRLLGDRHRQPPCTAAANVGIPTTYFGPNRTDMPEHVLSYDGM